MIKARLRNYVSQLTIIIMPYMIFRVIFWLFIAVQVFLLLFCDKIDRYISPRALMVALVFKCAFVIAYIVYTNIAIDLPSPMFLNIIGYIFLFMLLIFIWRLYLSKTIKDDKTYQMVNLRRTRTTLSAESKKVNTFSKFCSSSPIKTSTNWILKATLISCRETNPCLSNLPNVKWTLRKTNTMTPLCV